MTYIVESFSWGKDLMIPEVERRPIADIEEARRLLAQQWEVPGCFHVRVLSQLEAGRFNLHCMKSRLTSDRELHRSFERILAPDGVATVRSGRAIDVLRVSDFAGAAPVGLMDLPATKFFVDFLGGGTIEIGTNPSKHAGLGLQNFEVGMAAAAYIPSEMEALIPQDDDWYFLSEVNVEAGEARLSFESTVSL